MILTNNVMEKTAPYLNKDKLKSVLNSLVAVHTTTAIIDTYAELLFQSNKLDFERTILKAKFYILF